MVIGNAKLELSEATVVAALQAHLDAALIDGQRVKVLSVKMQGGVYGSVATFMLEISRDTTPVEQPFIRPAA